MVEYVPVKTHLEVEILHTQLGYGLFLRTKVTAWLVAHLSDARFVSVSEEAAFESDDIAIVQIIRNVHKNNLKNRLRPLQVRR